MRVLNVKLVAGEVCHIPVSFGYFTSVDATASSKRFCTGTVEALFVEYLDNDKAKVICDGNVLIVSTSQLV